MRTVAAIAMAALAVMVLGAASDEAAEKAPDPNWNKDYAGAPRPMLEEGSSCLFCHRNPIGQTWQKDRHAKTVKSPVDAEEAMAALREAAGAEKAETVNRILGHGGRKMNYLRAGEAYGTVDLLSAGFVPGEGVVNAETVEWNSERFQQRCAGCHTTGYDTTAGAFQSVALDCYTCHGSPPIEHTEDESLVRFSGDWMPPPKVVASICGRCHIRTGESKSTGQPFPNNYVPGADLFRDFEVDFSNEAIEKLNPIDRHVLENVKAIREGNDAMDCLDCHRLHIRSSLRHRRLPDSPYCFMCHKGEDTESGVKDYEVHSELCGY